MSQLWWQMPGPRRFCLRITESLQEGKNVLLQLPAGYPEGLQGNIHLLVGRPAEHWRVLSIKSGANYRPIDLLVAQFTGTRPDRLATAGTLANHPKFKGYIIWIDGVESQNWPLWHQFMLDYEHACRALGEYERSVFCLTLVGSVAETPITPQISLDVWRYEQVAGLLDALLYTATIMPEDRIVGIKRRVAITVIAHLALWDPALCEWLARCPLATILRPAAVLQDFACRRGWDRGDTTIDWCQGTLQTVDGIQQQHSAIYAFQQDDRELVRRIWIAQLSEIFPLLEQRRQDLLRDLDGYLSVPFTTNYGEIISEKQDLELGHIVWQLGQLQRAGRRDIRIQQAIQSASRLKKMRDTLAHLKVLDEQSIAL